MNAVVKTEEDTEVLGWVIEKWHDCDKVDVYTDRIRGKLLCEARERFPGDTECGKWRNANLHCKTGVARKLMQVWREFGTEMPDWSVSVMYELASAPPALVEDMRERYIEGDKPSLREMRQLKSIRPAPVVQPKAELPSLPPLDAIIPRIPVNECMLPIEERVKLPFAPWMVLGMRPPMSPSLINPETIGIIYKGLAHKYHPDKTGGDDTIFKAIKRAAETLGYGS